MKILNLVFGLALLTITLRVTAQEAKPLEASQWPVTVAAAVTDIVSALSDANKVTLRETRRSDLIKFHHGWGTGIRNHYGLWRGNTKLLESACGKPCHPDDASMIIIEKVWESLQEKA